MNRLKKSICVLCTILVHTAGAATPITITGTTRQVTTNSAAQTDPHISGDLVVYSDSRHGNDDVYLFNLSTNTETQLTTATTPQHLADVNGTRVVYTDFTPPIARIALYDVTTGSTTLISSGSDGVPRIDGQIVVFEKLVGGTTYTTDICAVDLSTMAEFPVAATSGAIEDRDAVSGTRVVFRRRASSDSPGQIVMVDLSTMTETALTDGTSDAVISDIKGNLVVWEIRSTSGDAIVVLDLSTGITKQLLLPHAQLTTTRAPRISGRFVTFEDESTGTPEVDLYHVDSGQVFPISTSSGIRFLADIDGNRVAYVSNETGNLDIFLFEFTVQPAVDVAPSSVQFGSVNLGSSQAQLITAGNLQNIPLTVQSISLDSPAAGFSFGPLTLPQVLPVGGSLDIPVQFTPAAVGAASNTLRIHTAVGDVTIPLAGQGVSTTPPPQQQIADILTFFDASAQSGKLTGAGNGQSAAGRLNALRNMLKAAGDLIQQGDLTDACPQLQDALDRTDGNPRPPDFVTGPAAAELAQKIQALRSTLGCGA